MGFVLLFLLIVGLVFVLIAVHETGHYLAGLMGGIPARDLKVVLFAFPQHVAVRDGSAWVSPVRDLERFIAVTRRHFVSRWAAFRWVAGGMVLELTFAAAVWATAVLSGYPAVAGGHRGHTAQTSHPPGNGCAGTPLARRLSGLAGAAWRTSRKAGVSPPLFQP